MACQSHRGCACACTKPHISSSSALSDAPPAHPRARFPPQPARDARTPARYDSPAATPALFLQFFDDGGGTDMWHARGIPSATGVHRHGDDLLLDCGGVIEITYRFLPQQTCAHLGVFQHACLT